MSMVSLMAQMVMNTPAVQKTWVRSFDWEDLLEKGMGTQPTILPGKFHELDRGAWQAKVHGITKSWA